jgi:hypothetical protein
VQYTLILGWLVPKIPQRGWKAKELYEAHFNAASDQATILSKRPDEAAKPSLTVKDYIGEENMIVEYNSKDMFGDWDLAPFIFIDFN